MRHCILVLLIIATFAGATSASDNSDLLNLVPKQADLALVIDHPKQALESVLSYPPVKQLLSFPAVQEQFDSTNGKRFAQLVAHFEKTLGHPWPDLIDKLAGGGVCLAVRIEGDPNPSLLVIKANDEELMAKAFKLILEVVRQESERSESPIKITSAEYRGMTGYHIGDGFVALAGPVLFVSNRKEGLKAALDLYHDGPAESFAKTELPAAARKLLPPNPSAWLVANLARVQEQPKAKEAYGYPKADPGQVIIFQGITDVAGRSPFLTLGFYAKTDGLQLGLRMPAGRNATPDGLATHFPAEGQPGSLPLLEPNHVLASGSFYLNLGKLWTERGRLFEEDFRTKLEGAQKQFGRFLGGRQLADVMTSIGNHHRFVVVHQTTSPYTKKPDQLQPAVAIVSDLKSPAYADAMNAILRTTAFVLGTPVRLKYKEEKVGSVTLVTYRFPEDGTLAGDNDNNRFNISPCFAKVGDQFLMASTVELGREMVELLQRPQVNDSNLGGPQSSRLRVYSSAGAELLKTFEDQLITQTILDRAVSSADARREVAAFVAWLKQLGRLEIDSDYGTTDYRLDLRLTNLATPKK